MRRGMRAMLTILVTISLLANLDANIDMNIEPTLRHKRDEVGTALAALSNLCGRLFDTKHGCWCGKGNRCWHTVDNVDWCCKQHDGCYDNYPSHKKWCDNVFSACLNKYC